MTVVRPGLPTLADLYVLLPSPRPTRKRSITSDKVCPAASSPGPPCMAEGVLAIHDKPQISVAPHCIKTPFSPITV